MQIPKNYLDLLTGTHIVDVATVNPDGSPQVTPMWVDYDEATNEVVVNTATGRKKARNMNEGAKVALSIVDRENAYRYLAIQGVVASVTTEGAEAHIDSLAKKYMGREKYPLPEGETRLKIRIKPVHVYPPE